MPEVAAAVRSPWRAATAVTAASRSTWRAAAPVQSVGSPFTPATPPGGGTTIGPGDLSASKTIEARSHYAQVHTASMVDTATGDVIDCDSFTISIDDGSTLWQLRAAVNQRHFALFAAVDAVVVEVTLDGLAWRFLIDEVQRPRQFNSDTVNITGRSVASIAGAPYQVPVNWISDAPTTAAQVASGAQSLTSVAVDWLIEDWLIPAGALSFTGTPLALVQFIAAAAGAMVTAHRTEQRVVVSARYEELPARWLCFAPDVQVAWDAVLSDSFQRADQPAYNAVLLAGQQQGAYGYVRLDGTSGAVQAPVVTDALLTDEPALRQRGKSILAAGGPQARVTRTLPVLTGAGEPGVLEPGQLVRWVDPGDVWVGLVRSVSLSVAMPEVTQTVTVERHLGAAAPDAPTPFLFVGPIPDQTFTQNQPVNFSLASHWSGGVNPRSYSLRSGALPAGLAFDNALEAITGTPTAVGASTLRVRAIDAEFRQADSTEFDITVSP